MTSTMKDIIANWLHEVRYDLVESYEDKGLRASGKWADSLSEEVQHLRGGEYTATVRGQHYTEYMQNGRRPNQDQSKEGIRRFVNWAGSTFIADWVADKGLNISPFAVAYKIAEFGTTVPNPHNKGNVVADVVNTKRIASLGTLLTSQAVIFAASDIRLILKQH